MKTMFFLVALLVFSLNSFAANEPGNTMNLSVTCKVPVDSDNPNIPEVVSVLLPFENLSQLKPLKTRGSIRVAVTHTGKPTDYTTVPGTMVVDEEGLMTATGDWKIDDKYVDYHVLNVQVIPEVADKGILGKFTPKGDLIYALEVSGCTYSSNR